MSRTAEEIYQHLRNDLPAWWTGDPQDLTEATIRSICEVFATVEAADEALHDRTFIGRADGAWLDEHGLERRIHRLVDETDDAYRVRLLAVEDMVTPEAILAGVERVLRVPGAELLEYAAADAFFLNYSFLNHARFWPAAPPFFVIRIHAQVASRAERAFAVLRGASVDIRTFLGAGGPVGDSEAAAMFLEGGGLVGDDLYRQIYQTVKRLKAGGVGFRIEVIGDSDTPTPAPSPGSLRVAQDFPRFPSVGSLMNAGSPACGWVDEFINPPTVNTGPWRAGHSFPAPWYTDANEEIVSSEGDLGGGPTVALGQEYAAYSDPPTTITGIEYGQIDSGLLSLELKAAITRRSGEALDECRLSVVWLDGSGAPIGSAVSGIIGTADGLVSPGSFTGLSNWTWRDFTRAFVAPALTRKFRVRLVAIKRNAAQSYARVQFSNFGVDAIV